MNWIPLALTSLFVFPLATVSLANTALAPARVIVPRADMDGSTAAVEDRGNSTQNEAAFVFLDSPKTNLGLFYLDSRWSELSHRIQNGSLGFQFSVSREFVRNIETGLGFTSFFGASESNSQNNVYGLHLDAHVKTFLWNWRLRPYVAGVGHWGAYRAWTRQSESSSSIAFRKHGEGFLFGVSPTLGVQAEFPSRLGVEVFLGYRAFIDNPQLQIGGWFTGLQLSFSR